MSTIRPGLPAPMPSPQTPAISPARAELMRMMGINAPAAAAAPVPTPQAAPQSAVILRPVQVRLDPAAQPDPNQPVRPGSFLDIRV